MFSVRFSNLLPLTQEWSSSLSSPSDFPTVEESAGPCSTRSVLSSHWSSSYNTALSLVETFIVLKYFQDPAIMSLSKMPPPQAQFPPQYQQQHQQFPAQSRSESWLLIGPAPTLLRSHWSRDSQCNVATPASSCHKEPKPPTSRVYLAFLWFFMAKVWLPFTDRIY